MKLNNSTKSKMSKTSKINMNTQNEYLLCNPSKGLNEFTLICKTTCVRTQMMRFNLKTS